MFVGMDAAQAQPGVAAGATSPAGDTRLVISCSTKGARVFLDGAELFVGPGRVARSVKPGRHEVAAIQPGRIADRRIFSITRGTSRIVALTPLPMDSTVRQNRRWRPSVPWIVVGSGAAAVLIAIPLRLRASANFKAYGDDIARLCSDSGCTPDQIPSSVSSIETTAKRQNRAALVFAAGGVVAAAVGLVMVYLNHPRGPTVTAPVSLVPLRDRTGAMVTRRFSF